MYQNQQYKLIKRPVGLVKGTDFEFIEESIAAPSEGQVLVQNLLISVDPAMRGWMNEGKSYIEPVKLGDVMRAGTGGKVVASAHPDFKEGDYVTGALGVQKYALNDGKGLQKIDLSIAPLETYMSVLGMTGMTAYFGLLDVGEPKSGDVVVVSGAAGAVGSIVGQIAKVKGCTVVGIAGGEEKCRYVTEDLGFDACIDYKSGNLASALKQHVPKGVDVYFDNVGGETLDLLLTRLRPKARVVICGAISQYNNTTPIKGPSNYLSLLVNRARMEGFVVFDYAPRYGEAAREMATWIQQGKLKDRHYIVEGLKTFPDTLLKLFSGENTGKLLIKVAE